MRFRALHTVYWRRPKLRRHRDGCYHQPYDCLSVRGLVRFAQLPADYSVANQNVTRCQGQCAFILITGLSWLEQRSCTDRWLYNVYPLFGITWLGTPRNISLVLIAKRELRNRRVFHQEKYFTPCHVGPLHHRDSPYATKQASEGWNEGFHEDLQGGFL